MRKGQQPPWIVPDELWERIEPRVERRYRHPGRKRLDDRKVLCRILFVRDLIDVAARTARSGREHITLHLP